MAYSTTAAGADRSTRTSSTATDRREQEAGYVLATAALLLVPLMVFVAFAVDVGAWYSEASKVQRAADAAALAAIVEMPDPTSTVTAARAAATANGYEHGVNAQVLVTQISSQTVSVEITAFSPSYFGVVVGNDGIDITRFAEAEFNLPVPMGSPYSSIGAGTLSPNGVPVSNVWAGMMAFCVNPTWGDIKSFAQIGSRCTETGTPAASAYPIVLPANQSPTHDRDGYLWVVEVPPGQAGGVEVQIYDAGHCRAAYDAGTTATPQPSNDANDTVCMRFTLYEADGTVLNDNDNPVFQVWDAGVEEGCGAWTHHPNFVIPSTMPGRWLLRTQVLDNSDWNGQDYFGINLNRTAVPGVACSSVSAFPNYEANCPVVYARNLTPVRTASFGATAELFLAEVDPIHSGKTLKVTFWDPGEGMESIQILDPQLNEVPFVWTATGGFPTPTTAAPCAAGPHCLVVDPRTPASTVAWSLPRSI
ncbi:MAG: hypothetical protein ACI8TP_003404 [Acidimicrobiales bacterium]|jgi:hypothetical protein